MVTTGSGLGSGYVGHGPDDGVFSSVGLHVDLLLQSLLSAHKLPLNLLLLDLQRGLRVFL